MKEALPLVAYLAALGCATYLAAHGFLDKTAVATLIGAAVPTYWQRKTKGE